MVAIEDIIDIIRVVAWPAVVVTGLLVFRAPLSAFLRNISSRITKLQFWEVSLEIAQVSEKSFDWGAGRSDLRSGGEIGGTDVKKLVPELAKEEPTDYLLVDCSGDIWWTSRLFVYTVMMERMRGLRCVVFVERTERGALRFIGTATPQAVRWALAMGYPWLEAAFADGYAQVVVRPPFATGDSPALASLVPSTPILSKSGFMSGRIEVKDSDDVVKNFIKRLSYLARESPGQGWQNLSGSGTTNIIWEHAEWVTVRLLKEDLKSLYGKLDTSSVQESFDRSREERAQMILRRPGSFVALVDKDETFIGLVDRIDLATRAAEHAASL